MIKRGATGAKAAKAAKGSASASGVAVAKICEDGKEMIDDVTLKIRI